MHLINKDITNSLLIPQFALHPLSLHIPFMWYTFSFVTHLFFYSNDIIFSSFFISWIFKYSFLNSEIIPYEKSNISISCTNDMRICGTQVLKLFLRLRIFTVMTNEGYKNYFLWCLILHSTILFNLYFFSWYIHKFMHLIEFYILGPENF